MRKIGDARIDTIMNAPIVLYTAREAAAELKTCYMRVYRAMRRNRVPHYRAGASCMLDRPQLATMCRYLNRRKNGTPAMMPNPNANTKEDVESQNHHT
jgi:hypothetical protein